jgi:hypothetical protein
VPPLRPFRYLAGLSRGAVCSHVQSARHPFLYHDVFVRLARRHFRRPSPGLVPVELHLLTFALGDGVLKDVERELPRPEARADFEVDVTHERFLLELFRVPGERLLLVDELFRVEELVRERVEALLFALLRARAVPRFEPRFVWRENRRFWAVPGDCPPPAA